MSSNKLKMVIVLISFLIIFSFTLTCNNSGSDIEKETAILDEEKEDAILDESEEEDGKSIETDTGMSKEAEYILSIGNLLTRIGDHLILIGEVMDDYDYGDITLGDLKLYIGDFIMMFNESYYPEFLSLEPTIGYEDYHKYLGRAMEHIEKSNEYFQKYIDTNDEDEMSINLDGALLELEQGSEWIEKSKQEID